MKKIALIGSGFAGISASLYLSKAGHEVHVFEKNDNHGGRARQLKTENGYTFDMGPSWYWMPDVFEKFFSDFKKKVSDMYNLKLLEPAFDVVFDNNNNISIPSEFNDLCNLFESIEKGSSKKLVDFMAEAELKYSVGINNLIYKPGISLKEYLDSDFIKGITKLQVFTNLSSHVKKYFKDNRLVSIMEFPVLFLGAKPEKTPALYSLMNYAGLKLGTYYPEGGFGKIVSSMVSLAESKGVKFYYNSNVEKINVKHNNVTGITYNNQEFLCDAVISAADYHFTESRLLDKKYRNYTEKYWQTRTFAPSSLIFYLGINKKIDNIKHHTLFFDEDLKKHSAEIYDNPQWPAKPLFYVCCTSKSDENVAPAGHENLFLLMPIAPGLNDSEELREKYFKIMIERLEKQTGEKIIDFIDYKKSYCVNDFITDYNSYKGNAYGLANTLNQTAILKPKIFNRKVKNLFYAGQLTVPGPGVPPALISGKIVAEQVSKYFNSNSIKKK